MTAPVPPTLTNIEVIQGATFRMRVTWNDNQDPPQPISLTDYWAHLQICSKRGGSGTVLAELSSEAAFGFGLTLEPSDVVGAIDIRIGADVTATLKKKSVYDLFVIKRSDFTEAVRLVYGDLYVSLSATVNIPYAAGPG